MAIKIPVGNSNVGLGEMIKKITNKVGIEQCDKCKKRQKWLDDRVRFGKDEGGENGDK